MTIRHVAALAAMLSALTLPAAAATSGNDFFRELDVDGDGFVDRVEFDTEKGAVLYAIDKNHNLKIERSETRMSPQQFRDLAGADGVMEGYELFDVPSARFDGFDQNGDQKISAEEFRRHLATMRSGPQTAEKPAEKP